jgi:hypothetical protein
MPFFVGQNNGKSAKYMEKVPKFPKAVDSRVES